MPRPAALKTLTPIRTLFGSICLLHTRHFAMARGPAISTITDEDEGGVTGGIHDESRPKSMKRSSLWCRVVLFSACTLSGIAEGICLVLYGGLCYDLWA